jgi:hypothetical protein
MSKLLNRISSSKATSASSCDDESVVLLPLSMVQDYLSTIPALSACGVTVEEVHSALIRLHTSRCSEASLSPSPPPPLPIPKCNECGVGHEIVDDHGGYTMCSNCGVMFREGMNIRPEYRPPVEVKKRSGKRMGDSLPAWVREKMKSREGMGRKYSSNWDDLQHWNIFFRLSEEDVSQADALLLRWKSTGGEKRSARLLASLLYVQLKDKLPDEETIRIQLRRRRSLEEVSGGPPPPQFGCTRCGEKHHTAKGSRFCCKR